MQPAKIVAICLVRNEELYLGQMLANIHEFCDEILLADNGSVDSTYRIAEDWAKKHAKIKCHSIKHPRESHEMIEPYVNTPTWIFAVDGDELYDPAGLQRFRSDVMGGKYDSCWQVSGNVLNCLRLDRDANKVEGYLSPPCRSMTKFFNFNAIKEWSNVENERLHGGNLVFKEGFDKSKRYPLNEEVEWDNALFRCLHLCFLPRSSLDRIGSDGLVARWNLAEQDSNGIFIKMCSFVLKKLGIYKTSKWKRDRYMRGELVSRPLHEFFDRAPQP